MTTQSPPTKAALIDALRTSGEKFVEKMSAMPAASFEDGRYENGWNARQILAHVASIEWTYPRLIDLAQRPKEQRAQAAPAQSSAAAPSAAPQTTPQSTTPVVMDYNERQVAKRDSASVAELLEEFQKNRAATIAAVEAADESLLTTPITSAGGAQGPLATVFDFVAVQHVLVHMRDIAGESA